MAKKKNLLIISRTVAPVKEVGAKRFSYISYYLDKKKYGIYFLSLHKKYFKIDYSIPVEGKIYETFMWPKFRCSSFSKLCSIYNKFCKIFAPIDLASGWIVPAILKGFKIIRLNKIDVIIATGPSFSNFVIGYILAKNKKIKLILDYRDPWLSNPNISTLLFRNTINPKLEKIILKEAQKVIFNNSKARNLYMNSSYKNLLYDKDIIITNGYLKKNNTVTNNHFNNFNKRKKRILYAGDLFAERKLSYLFNPLKALITNNKLNLNDFEIIVYGKVSEEDVKKIKELDLAEILTVKEPIEHKEILNIMKDAALLYLPQIKNAPYSIPLKFFDYLTAEKPILAIAEKKSATSGIIQQIKCGEVVDYEDFDGMYKALENIFILEKKYSFDNANEFSWENIVYRFENLIESIAKQNS